MANGERVSLETVEATEACEDYYRRHVRPLMATRAPVVDLEMTRRLRQGVQAAEVTDLACVGAVRKLRRNVDLPDPEPPAALARAA